MAVYYSVKVLLLEFTFIKGIFRSQLYHYPPKQRLGREGMRGVYAQPPIPPPPSPTEPKNDKSWLRACCLLSTLDCQCLYCNEIAVVRKQEFLSASEPANVLILCINMGKLLLHNIKKVCPHEEKCAYDYWVLFSFVSIKSITCLNLKRKRQKIIYDRVLSHLRIKKKTFKNKHQTKYILCTQLQSKV